QSQATHPSSDVIKAQIKDTVAMLTVDWKSRPAPRFATVSVFLAGYHTLAAAFCSLRWFFRSQCFASCFGAVDSHSEFAARSEISTAAKYFGAFAAGFPNGTSNFAAINGAI